MAGYLGTLFMGGVGLRLVLPPASQFAKLVNTMHASLKKAGDDSLRLSTVFSNRRRQKLVEHQKQAQELVKQLDQKYDKDKRIKLQHHLAQINKLNANAAITSQKALNQFAAKGGAWKGVSQTIKSDLDTVGFALTPFEKLLDKVQDKLGAIWDALFNITKNLVGSFMNAIQRSTMFIITFGFQIGMLARNFMTFEKELINANSIFQTTRENLYAMSDEVIKFGLHFGINYEEASQVLYQFASAGLTAEESMVALKDTLTLTMAVQGDFNTLGKLMVQVIKGFGLEMDVTAEIADKFAYTINKSLIEWKDLSAAVKFAMPFFVAAGQSVDQLLGSLQILTDRALEAGIAGRGLRQAIAQFVEHADDNNAAFRKLGVEILNTEGNMLELTDIALQFNEAMGEDVSKMDIMMTLMKDLNIRGATAFVHLAQNAGEFQKAVDDLVNSQGASNEMAEYQQASLANQIQLMKNAIFSVFYLSDEIYAGTGAVNGFDYALKDLVETLKSRFITTAADGTQVLTDFGYALRDVVIKFIYNLGDVLENIIDIMISLTQAGKGLFDSMTVLFWAIKEVTDVLVGMDPWLLKIGVQMWFLTNMFGFGVGVAVAFGLAMKRLGQTMADIHPALAAVAKALVIIVGVAGGAILGATTGALKGAMMGAAWGARTGTVPGTLGGAGVGATYGAVAGGLAGAAGGYAIMRGMSGAVSGMGADAYGDSAAGAPTPLASYSNELNNLTVNNAWFNTNDLSYLMEDSATVAGG